MVMREVPQKPKHPTSGSMRAPRPGKPVKKAPKKSLPSGVVKQKTVENAKGLPQDKPTSKKPPEPREIINPGMNRKQKDLY